MILKPQHGRSQEPRPVLGLGTVLRLAEQRLLPSPLLVGHGRSLERPSDVVRRHLQTPKNQSAPPPPLFTGGERPTKNWRSGRWSWTPGDLRSPSSSSLRHRFRLLMPTFQLWPTMSVPTSAHLIFMDTHLTV